MTFNFLLQVPVLVLSQNTSAQWSEIVETDSLESSLVIVWSRSAVAAILRKQMRKFCCKVKLTRTRSEFGHGSQRRLRQQ